MKSFINKTSFLISAFSVLIFFNGQSLAQSNKTEIFILGGYLLNSSVTVNLGELDFDDGFTGTLGIDVPVDRAVSAELSWSMSGSKASLNQYVGGRKEITDLVIHHFQVGGIFEPNKRKKASPYGLISLGASLYHPTDPSDPKEKYDDEWRFSFALGGGVKINLSDRIGLRFQGRLIVPMQFAGGSIYVGTGGTGVSVGAYTSFVEGDFTGGLFFRL